jgi:hypothetical protein
MVNASEALALTVKHGQLGSPGWQRWVQAVQRSSREKKEYIRTEQSITSMQRQNASLRWLVQAADTRAAIAVDTPTVGKEGVTIVSICAPLNAR